MWQKGDEACFDVLYKRYVLQLLRLVGHKIGSEENAKELTQDIFLAVYLQKDKLDKVDNFKGYLFGIAKHKIFNYYRHELVKQKYQLSVLMNESELSANAKDILENKQLIHLIRLQIEKLPPKCREVFRLSREENLSYKSIAEKLNISENTVDQHIQKALRILRAVTKSFYLFTFFLLFCVATGRFQKIKIPPARIPVGLELKINDFRTGMQY